MLDKLASQIVAYPDYLQKSSFQSKETGRVKKTEVCTLYLEFLFIHRAGFLKFQEARKYKQEIWQGRAIILAFFLFFFLYEIED